MKKTFLTLCLLIATIGGVSAQSSMSDDQVIKYITKEHKAGKSQQQIVTQLVQRGVTVDQIRRVRQKYERMEKNQGLGTVSKGSDEEQVDARLRRNNGSNNATEKLKDERLATQRSQQGLLNQRYQTKDEQGVKQELDDFMPDSLDIYDQQVIRNYLKKKQESSKKVFGRDIFNKEELSFEPNMNIATPDNYVLGAGDAVFIDIYGASQKTVEATVSPDGFVEQPHPFSVGCPLQQQ